VYGVAFGQNFKDTLYSCPYDIKSFDFDTTNYNDITVLEIHISENDTVSKEIKAQYKINSKGHIIAKKTIFRELSFEAQTNFSFYSYRNFPTIYSIDSYDYKNEKTNISVFIVDNIGRLKSTSYYCFLEGKNAWKKYNYSEDFYNIKGELVKKISIDNHNDPDYRMVSTEYYPNGHIKKETFYSKDSNKKDTIKYEKVYLDSNNYSFHKLPAISYEQGNEIIEYNNEGTIISKSYFRVVELDTIRTKWIYEYDKLKRLAKESYITIDDKGKSIGGVTHMYIYNTILKPNFDEIEDHNSLF
jgi:hypothetical protein